MDLLKEDTFVKKEYGTGHFFSLTRYDYKKLWQVKYCYAYKNENLQDYKENQQILEQNRPSSFLNGNGVDKLIIRKSTINNE